MATSDLRGRRGAWAVLGLLAPGLIALAVWSLLRVPPQMGADPEVFETVDALYTAVRNRDEPRMLACEKRFAEYRASGALPASAADSLARIIRTARDGSWERAAERLYDFMLAQRREGAVDRPAHKESKGDTKGQAKDARKR